MTPPAKVSESVRRLNPDLYGPTVTVSRGARGKSAEDERALHNAILDECKRRGWIAFHGSMAHSTFRTKGEPDFVILGSVQRWDNEKEMWLPFSVTYLIEAKTRTGKLSVDQQAIHAWAEKLGHTIHVVRSMDEFLEIINA